MSLISKETLVIGGVLGVVTTLTFAVSFWVNLNAKRKHAATLDELKAGIQSSSK